MKLFKSHHPQYRDGEQMRDFVLVDDVVDVLFFALEKPIARGIFNLGSGQARTWLDLVRGVFRALDKPERIEFIDTPEELRARYQYFTEAAMEKLRAEGYTKPFTPLEKGVAATVARLRSQLSH
jgi:ADP-L-glycero-D-manno-heptose 6-epimerase